MSLVQQLKDALVGLGPENLLTQTALRLSLSRQGFRLGFTPVAISVTKDSKTILMRPEVS